MAAGAARTKSQPSGDALDDYRINLEAIRQDLPYAQRAVVIHQREDWPAGMFCRNCHAHWPCRLYRWGFSVLNVAGWTTTDLHRLVERAEAGDVPWL